MKSQIQHGLQFQGELHEIHLVNFSVDVEEVASRLPAPLRPRVSAGRALISMVDVHLRNMRAQSAWLPFRFHYQHIGFRLLIEDAQWNAEHSHKGIFFLDSFTDRPFLAWAGNLVANFRLQPAQLLNYPSGLTVNCGDRHLHYHLAGPVLEENDRLTELKSKIGAIDRAWAVVGDELQKTQIVREKWPLQAMNYVRFETNFFESAKLEGVFRVPETIHYTWLPAETVLRIPSLTPTAFGQLSHA